MLVSSVIIFRSLEEFFFKLRDFKVKYTYLADLVYRGIY